MPLRERFPYDAIDRGTILRDDPQPAPTRSGREIDAAEEDAGYQVADFVRKAVGSRVIAEWRSLKNSRGESCDTPIELVASMAHAGYFNDR